VAVGAAGLRLRARADPLEWLVRRAGSAEDRPIRPGERLGGAARRSISDRLEASPSAEGAEIARAGPQAPALLREQYGVDAPVDFYDHHYCHATSAYYTSGFDRALVVTLDGGGDGRSGSVWVGDGGRLREIGSVDSFNSLGNFYSYVTELCGFRAERHEGKITGLAAYGEPAYAEILRGFVRYRDPGDIRYTVPMYHLSALKLLADRLPAGFDHATLAASVQTVLEEIGTAFVRYWLRRTGLRDLVVAGGVFANVKLNQRVHEMEEVDRFFVHPAMDDSGLSVGSALASLAAHGKADPRTLCTELPGVYLGPEYDDDAIGAALGEYGLRGTAESAIHERIADLLAAGAVVARFHGRMEYGPRALGHRSILYQTTEPSVNDWLNQRLKRTEFMPFAPATLSEFADRCYHGVAGAESTARFMTITFPCTDEMRRMSPGVVHVDGTARPQLLDAVTAPDLTRIVSAYHRRTGIPSVVNTSFNMHEEPIVCTPQDAIRAFLEGGLDYLAIGNWLVRGSDGRRAATGQDGRRRRDGLSLALRRHAVTARSCRRRLRRLSPGRAVGSRPSSPSRGHLLAAAAVLSLLPDLDSVLGILMGDFGRYHNNLSHSVFMALVAALSIGAVARYASRGRFMRSGSASCLPVTGYTS
jgi:carbamoyltransferase